MRELFGWYAGVGNSLYLMRVRELAIKPRGMDVLRQQHGRAIMDLGEGPAALAVRIAQEQSASPVSGFFQ